MKQEDLNFQWTTNMFVVKGWFFNLKKKQRKIEILKINITPVLGAPNWRTHLMEDKLTKPIFGWMPNETFVAASTIFLFLVFTACIIAGTAWFIR